MEDILAYFESNHFGLTQFEREEDGLRIGDKIQILSEFTTNNINDVAVILLGCGEYRGQRTNGYYQNSADNIRQQIYNMYGWHDSIKVGDLGNLIQGKTIKDTKSILNEILTYLNKIGKIVIVLGGSHDLTFQQYLAFKNQQKLAEITNVDMLIDLEDSEGIDDRNYLMELLTGDPNFVRNYNHIAFQSYYVNPKILEALDKLRFDFHRLGKVRSSIADMEPILRRSDILSIDMNVLRASEAPFNPQASPNGLFGDEVCQLVRYAGMSEKLTSLGIYNYHADFDTQNNGATLIAQMIWYFIDGIFVRKNEAEINNENGFIDYHIPGQDTAHFFKKSKRTGRWWMALTDNTFVPCSYNDYLTASNHDVPELWYREQERIL